MVLANPTYDVTTQILIPHVTQSLSSITHLRTTNYHSVLRCSLQHAHMPCYTSYTCTTHTHAHTHARAHTHTYTCTCTYTHIHMHSHMPCHTSYTFHAPHIHTLTHTHSHTHTHTTTQRCVRRYSLKMPYVRGATAAEDGRPNQL